MHIRTLSEKRLPIIAIQLKGREEKENIDLFIDHHRDTKEYKQKLEP